MQGLVADRNKLLQRFHPNRLHWAVIGADAAALAVVKIDLINDALFAAFFIRDFFDFDRHLGTIGGAAQTPYAIVF